MKTLTFRRLEEGDSVRVRGKGFVHFQDGLFWPNKKLRKLYKWESSYSQAEMEKIWWERFGDAKTGNSPGLDFFPRTHLKRKGVPEDTYFPGGAELGELEIFVKEFKTTLLTLSKLHRDISIDKPFKKRNVWHVHPRVCLESEFDYITLEILEDFAIKVSDRYRRFGFPKRDESVEYPTLEEFQAKFVKHVRIFQ